ncbi:hypothetical protein Q5X48_12690 [Acinetobacter baumannii]|nr:hypothetical protein [Acinetobacter baumannii]
MSDSSVKAAKDNTNGELEKQRKEFKEKHQSIVNRIENILNHELYSYSNIEDKSLISHKSIESIKLGIETILNIVNRELFTPESNWVLEVVGERLKNIEMDFYTLDNTLKVNLKDEEILKIGLEPDSVSFQEFFEKMIKKIDHLRYSLDYLSNLNSILKHEANKVFLLSNNELVENLKKAKDSLVKEVEDFRKSRAISDNAKTEDIYNNAVSKYKGLEDKYRCYFYISIILLVFISIGLFIIKNTLVPKFYTNTEFWIFKGSVVVVGITLISYFLKQSSHYQRLADQNYQTQVELQAYPSFMESIPTEEAASVRKELALKYFGREVDGAAHKDMSNLISDQMKSTTDMVKAVTEVIKKPGNS